MKNWREGRYLCVNPHSFLSVQLILQWRVFDIVNRDVYRNLSLKSQNMI